jgi:hypothetical protein
LASASFDGTTSIWAVQQGVWEEVSGWLLLWIPTPVLQRNGEEPLGAMAPGAAWFAYAG